MHCRYLSFILGLSLLSLLHYLLYSGRHEPSVATTRSSEYATHPPVSINPSLNHIDSLLDSLAVQPRPFPLWNKPLPCVPPEDNRNRKIGGTPVKDGFLFVKSPKTGSSTGAGIHLRIASNIGRRNGLEACKNSFRHIKAFKFANRNPTKSFLWSIVRDPKSRSISEFFHFQVSRRGVAPSDENIIGFLGNLQNNQLGWLRLPKANETRSSEVRYPKRNMSEAEAISTILRNYDFIGVTERMDETAVALQMILGLNTSDVMFLKR